MALAPVLERYAPMASLLPGSKGTAIDVIALIEAGIWKQLMEEKQKKARVAKAGGSVDVAGSGSDTGCDDSSPPTVPRGGTAGEEEETWKLGILLYSTCQKP